MAANCQITLGETTYEILPGLVLTSDPPQIPVRITSKGSEVQELMMWENKYAELYQTQVESEGLESIPERFWRYFVKFDPEQILEEFRKFTEGMKIIHLDSDSEPEWKSECFWICTDITPAGVPYLLIATANDSPKYRREFDKFHQYLKTRYGYCMLDFPETDSQYRLIRYLDRKQYNRIHA